MTTIIARDEPQLHPTETGEMHLALFYCGESEYVDGVMQFVDPALEADEPVAIAVPGQKAELLREVAHAETTRALPERLQDPDCAIDRLDHLRYCRMAFDIVEWQA